MSQTLNQEFGKLRSLFWPIHRHELKKLLPMLIILFLICFNYSILRNAKDALVVTSSGAAVIPFIKVWVMLPMAVLLTFIFTRLSNRFSQESVFYIMISMFLAFFILFAFVLYPFQEMLHPTDLAVRLQETLPAGFQGLIAMCCNWSFTLFYVISELWSTCILTVLFWGFANEVTSLGEARRFYGVLGVGASCAAIVAGQLANFLSESELMAQLFSFISDPWGRILMTLVSVVTLSGLAAMMIFWRMNRTVLANKDFHDPQGAASEHKKKLKPKFSLKDSILYISRSSYLICIALIVVGYNLVINMTEILWKDQLCQLYAAPADYNNYMNNLTSAIGLLATLTALFMAKIIEKLGWIKTAMITPLMLFITSIGFFGFFLFQNYWIELFPFMEVSTPLVIAVFFGGAQNCLSKAAKYSVFDTTKEMAFIPLDPERRINGKAAIDGIGSRIGKSGGSLVYQGLLMMLGSVSASAPYVAFFLVGVLLLWMGAVRILGRQFNTLTGRAPESQLVTANP